MPVPVYLMFSVRLLEYVGVEASQGRLRGDTETGGSFEFLSSLEFRDIYHDESVGPKGSIRRGEILNARHSEILVPERLNLEHLRYIVCRSEAERDTLLNLLSGPAQTRWVSVIIVDEGRGNLFFKRGTFVEGYELGSERINIQFYANCSPEFKGPFDVGAIVDSGGREMRGAIRDYVVKSTPVTFTLPRRIERYGVRVTLNEELALLGTYDDGVGVDSMLVGRKARSDAG